jgi:hypothetical protein
MIRIDIDPATLSGQHATEVRVWTEARSSFEALAPRITPSSREDGTAAHRAAGR